MGREGYSIIGQGKIDEILSAKSGDRREIFEEAAGISKFRHRKEEAERKLERTEENLVRINDKIAELELQVEPLREQAEKAKKYLVLRDELRLLEISVWLENLDTPEGGRPEAGGGLAAPPEAQRDEAQRRSGRPLCRGGAATAQQMREKDVEAERRPGRVRRAGGADRGAGVRRRRAGEHRHPQPGEHPAGGGGAGRARRAAAGGLATQAEEQEARVAEIDRRIGELNGAAGRPAGDGPGHGGTGRRRRRARRSACGHRRPWPWPPPRTRGPELAAAAAEKEQIQERRAAARARQGRRGGAAAVQPGRRRGRTGAPWRTPRTRRSAAANIIAGHSLRMEERRKKADRGRGEAGEADHGGGRPGQPHPPADGDGEGVRGLLQGGEAGAARRRAGLRGIHGPVANLVKTEGRYSLAIEIALGAGLQNIVVDREEDAKAAISLPEAAGRRPGHLPAPHRHPGRRAPGKGRGGGVRLCGHRVPAGALRPQVYRTSFHNLLGRTVIAEDLDCGIAMARKYRNAFRIVTLDGQVINRGGSMTGGSASRQRGRPQPGRRSWSSSPRRTAAMHGQARRRPRQAEEAPRRELAAAQYELETAQAQRRARRGRGPAAGGRRRSTIDQPAALPCGRAWRTSPASWTSLAGRLADNDGPVAAARVDDRPSRKSAAADARAAGGGRLSPARSELLEKSECPGRGESAAGRAIWLPWPPSGRPTVRRAPRTCGALCGGSHRRPGAEGADGWRPTAENIADRGGGDRRTAEAAPGGAGGPGRRPSGSGWPRISQEKNALEAERTAKNRAGQEMNENAAEPGAGGGQAGARSGPPPPWRKSRSWTGCGRHYELSHSDAQAQRIELESVPKANRRIGELKRDIGALGTINIGRHRGVRPGQQPLHLSHASSATTWSRPRASWRASSAEITERDDR